MSAMCNKSAVYVVVLESVSMCPGISSKLCMHNEGGSSPR
jgi:hypothetical protein